MPKLLRDFHCHACGERFERFIDTNTMDVQCKCGAMAQKVIGMPRVSLEGISGDFPGAHARWAKIREDNAKIKAKRS